MKPILILAGLGGMINAFLCYAGLPVPFKDAGFRLDLLPAGALHGAILAVVPFWLAQKFGKRKTAVKIAVLLLGGYLAGYVSTIPLSASISHKISTDLLTFDDWYEPYAMFGLVSCVYFFGLAFLGAVGKKDLALHLACGILSGFLGSLWFWIETEPWYLSFLHGSIWGVLAGVGAWLSLRRS